MGENSSSSALASSPATGTEPLVATGSGGPTAAGNGTLSDLPATIHNLPSSAISLDASAATGTLASTRGPKAAGMTGRVHERALSVDSGPPAIAGSFRGSQPPWAKPLPTREGPLQIIPLRGTMRRAG